MRLCDGVDVKRPRDREWWQLLGCGLPFIPLLIVGVPLFLLGVRWMAARQLPRSAEPLP